MKLIYSKYIKRFHFVINKIDYLTFGIYFNVREEYPLVDCFGINIVFSPIAIHIGFFIDK